MIDISDNKHRLVELMDNFPTLDDVKLEQITHIICYACMHLDKALLTFAIKRYQLKQNHFNIEKSYLGFNAFQWLRHKIDTNQGNEEIVLEMEKILEQTISFPTSVFFIPQVSSLVSDSSYLANVSCSKH